MKTNDVDVDPTSVCISTQYEVQGVCYDCYDKCKACTGPNPEQCLECYRGYELVIEDTTEATGQCECKNDTPEVCPNYTYKNKDDGTCVNCHDSC